MNNTIFNYFTPKTKSKNNTSVANCGSSSFKKSGKSLCPGKCKVLSSSKEVIVISSDEENDPEEFVPSKKRKVIEKLVTGVFPSSILTVAKGNNKSTCPQALLSDTGNTPSNDTSLVKDDEANSDASDVIDNSSNLPYYLRNFRLAMDTVINDEKDAILFNGEDATWIHNFYKLPISCQKLYTRLFHRKFAWLPIKKISYKEIGGDIFQHLNTLVKEKYVECNVMSGVTTLTLQEIMQLIPAPALKNVAKSFRVTITGSKEKITSALWDVCKHQKTVFGSKNHSLENAIKKKAADALGPCFKLAVDPKKAFNRVLLVFDVTKGTEDDKEFSLNSSNQPPYFGKSKQLSTILLAEMGQVVYPTYQIKKSCSVFEAREELLEYEIAYNLINEIYAATEVGKWEHALNLCESAEEIGCSIAEASKQRAVCLPHFIRGFSASAIYIRIKSLQVEILQRLRDYKGASNLLHSLMEEQHFCLTRRGYWSERLALNLDQHLHDRLRSLQVIQASLNDKYVRVGHVFALVERAQKLQASGKVKDFDFDAVLKDFNFSKATEATIVGRLLPKRMQTGQARFMKVVEGDDDVLLCSVEELALDHYKGEGYEQGIHGEGGTFTCFFCLLMWDIIFMNGIDDVFRTPYQTHPLDYNTDEFYLNRQDNIDFRIKQIKQWKSDDFCAIEMITKHWNAHEGVACTGMNWERFISLQQALSLAECIGGEILGGIVEVLSKDPRHTRSGLPDLVVWSSTSKSYKLVEVKGPGDRLSNNQKMWMHRLVELGAKVEVCHVTANASRKLSV